MFDDVWCVFRTNIFPFCFFFGSQELDDKKSEVDLLLMDVDHYKKKLQREKKQRECTTSCTTKTMESKEVQVNFDKDSDIHQNRLPVELNGLSNGQHAVSNGHHPNHQSNGLPNGLNENMMKYYVQILPVKYKDALNQIKEFEKNETNIVKKSNFYKELALSRRADIKKLEAKLAAVAQPQSSDATPDAEQ